MTDYTSNAAQSTTATFPAEATPASARRGNPIGLAAFVIAIVLVATEVVFGLVGAALVSTALNYDLYQVLMSAQSVLIALLAVIALALGTVGLVLPDRPRVLAAIGLAIGAHGIVGIALGLTIGGIIRL